MGRAGCPRPQVDATTWGRPWGAALTPPLLSPPSAAVSTLGHTRAPVPGELDAQGRTSGPARGRPHGASHTPAGREPATGGPGLRCQVGSHSLARGVKKTPSAFVIHKAIPIQQNYKWTSEARGLPWNWRRFECQIYKNRASAGSCCQNVNY